ncbi:hypothetical protein I302_104432 [Kwoniella bestiolae CBS 10118]|uniref:UDENN domain-containing protein n=1 Tax=Kwoniella bestiolae CBS 10118 TaxID=1296100 RepID=A0A1B9GB86_9TREE|nr:hypothetical protein I302_03137 [Kwoniella bestiolae CBS 10118]OCF28281.1 hypothetical protein I302_03137 [Kwoniella bestiolae CBS 10118]
MTTLPPLAAIFLTHFDDIKGQSVVFYASLPNLPAETIEHTTLPSGLHALDSDLVLFIHHELPGAGVFRSRLSDESSRGRKMGTLGVVLANRAVPSDLFTLHDPLSTLFDQLESLESSPFAPSTSTSPSNAVSILAKVWHDNRADSHPGSLSNDNSKMSGKEAVRGIRQLVEGRASLPIEHPIAYLPSLLGVLGPSIVPVYKAVLSGQRIILYSTPPLLPLAAFAWCIWSMSLSPPSTPDAAPSKWLGNVGLMDLSDLKKRTGGWVATTSDAIYKSHHTAYDMFIDLSSIPLSSHQSENDAHPSTPTPHILSTYHQPKNTPIPITYSFSDLPLYKSLLLLTSSPPTVHAGVSKTGGWWLLAFELFERAWKLCMGVCEFAVGRGRVGEEGHLRLDEGEEDARLLDEEDEIISIPPGEENEIDEEPEDEAIRRGRLILRQLYHNTYHLHSRLKDIIDARPRGEGSRAAPLNQGEVKQLVGGRWPLGGSGGEEQFWVDIARMWGMTVDIDE